MTLQVVVYTNLHNKCFNLKFKY